MARPQFTPQQRSFLVAEYHRTNSVSAVLQEFRHEYPNVRCPTRVTVYKNVRKYQATGTSLNLNKERSGRPRTGRSAANIQAVRDVLEEQQEADEDGRHGGRVSCRRNRVGLAPSTFNRITRCDLHLHPYQIIKRQQLLPGDQPRRLQFCT